MIPPKLRHILGSLAVSEIFFAKKVTLPRPNHIFKIQLEIHFWTLNTDRNAPKKNLELKYGHSHFKSALKINFWLRKVVKLKIHVYANTCIFSLTTSQNQKLIFKAHLKWECPYFYSKFFLERFGKYSKKSKNGFPIVFSKCDLAEVWSLFWRKKNSEKPNSPKYA